ncbi:hypothetical protein ABI59_15220 [Acidobacteria bacterium Mor1]|nr:hypothetical protein ABI59_15220 [Acidobacteria bacterium Mor1]
MLLAALAALPAAAVDIFVANHSFEDPAIAAGTFDTDAPAPPGWIEYGLIDFGYRTVGVLDPTGTQLYPGGAPHGDNVGVVFLLDDPDNQTMVAGIESGMMQTLSATLETDTIYTLTIEVGNIASDPNPPHDIYEFDGFPQYRIDLLAGGQILDSDANSLLPPEGEFLTSTVQVAIGANHPQEGAQLGIRLANLNAAPGIEVNFDNVRLSSTPAGAGEVPGGAGQPGPPLTVNRGIGAEVVLEWSPSCIAGDGDYAVYEGVLGDFGSHLPVGTPACTTGGGTTLSFVPGSAGRYFLVVPLNGADEGSYGVDSSGAARPASAAACGTRRVAACP